MAASTYRFLPWARRGLADRISEADSDAALPARAKVKVGITVSNIGETPYALQLYGPGDVIGVDPRMIVRAEPRPASSDAEPNYFALIEFDPPDFPWLFTPAKAGSSEHLRPWCVLLVVDLERVDPPRTEAGKPLPIITLSAEAAASELPDLAESWAWAHTQVLTPAGTVNIATELADKPAANVSRLLAPRRLEPGHRYAACLVPAFDAGVTRGLGDAPVAEAPLGPAWQAPFTRAVNLPVFFHWTFTTGPAGDFESLARRLKPFPAPPTLGVQPMFTGAAGPELPALPPGDPAATLLMDGALRAPARGAATLAEVPAALRAGLQAALDVPATQGSAGAQDSTAPLGPPLYGEWHSRQHTAAAALPAWQHELNLDPRARAAAGLGAEIERQNQESFMHWSWEQVGRILEANRLMSQARLSQEALLRVHAKHLASQPADRLMQLAAPLTQRTRQGTLTLQATVAASSLPDAATDPALRRLVSPQRPLLAKAQRRGGVLRATDRAVPRVSMLSKLASGALDVDPGRFVPSGLQGLPALDALALPGTGDGGVALQSIGLPITAGAAALRQLRADTAALAAASAPSLAPRSTLASTGMLAEAHLLRARELLSSFTQPGTSLTAALGEVVKRRLPAGSIGVFVQVGTAATAQAQPLTVDATGQVRVLGGTASPVLATIPAAQLSKPRFDATAAIAALPVNSLSLQATRPLALRGTRAVPIGTVGTVSTGVTVGTLDTTVVGGAVVGGTGVATVGGTAGGTIGGTTVGTGTVSGEFTVVATITLPPPQIDLVPIQRLEASVTALAPGGQLGPVPPVQRFVGFDIGAARNTLLSRSNPRITVPARLAGQLGAGGGTLLDRSNHGLMIAPTLDRILAAPEIDAPVYEYLAALAPERFLPGVGEIPEDAITLLETNPRFIESLLVGLNHEMNRELLWRGFPTDQRGTPLRRFWDWADGGADIPPIHGWAPGGALGANGRSGAGGQITLLVRGRLLRRYPNSVLLAWRAQGNQLIKAPTAADIRTPVFGGALGNDIVFAGFDLTDTELLQGDGWFFVLAEQPSEPRFGFDEPDLRLPSPALTAWTGADWRHTGTAPGGWLHIDGNPLAGRQFGAVRFVDHAAHLAMLTLQVPMRIAVHARSLLA
jgi:hypothetical protein